MILMAAISKLPIRQLTCLDEREQYLLISKLPMRQLTRWVESRHIL